MVKISPSILSADFANLEKELNRLADAGADFAHVDVMDGHFVPNISIGVPVVKALSRVTPLPLDVHLMISDPAFYLDDFIKVCKSGIIPEIICHGFSSKGVQVSSVYFVGAGIENHERKQNDQYKFNKRLFHCSMI